MPVFSCPLKQSNTFVGDFFVQLEEISKQNLFRSIDRSKNRNSYFQA